MIRPEQKKLFAVIGNPVRHSLSPVMMTAAFKAMGVQALYAALYVDELVQDLELLHKAGYSGLSVTVPYKEIACRLSVEIDETAEDIGAVNTLLRSNLGWQGRNTDWIGALRALSRVTEIGDRSALVLGRRRRRPRRCLWTEKGRGFRHDFESMRGARQEPVQAVQV